MHAFSPLLGLPQQQNALPTEIVAGHHGLRVLPLVQDGLPAPLVLVAISPEAQPSSLALSVYSPSQSSGLQGR